MWTEYVIIDTNEDQVVYSGIAHELGILKRFIDERGDHYISMPFDEYTNQKEYQPKHLGE